MNSSWQQFRRERWAQGVQCIWCSASRVRLHSVRASGAQRYLCLACGRVFSDTSGTFLHGSKAALSQWEKARSGFSKNRLLTAKALQRHSGVSYPTARRMLGVLQRMARVRELERNKLSK